MPTYEYRCDKCGHEFERDQRITEDPIKTCPKCKAPKAKRLISATSFVLKGGGWYSDLYSSGKSKDKTDSPPSGESAGAKAESKGDTKSEAKSDTKSESKAEAKADSKSDSSKKKPSKSNAAA
jgi:putative FmdB family regulatory protein